MRAGVGQWVAGSPRTQQVLMSRSIALLLSKTGGPPFHGSVGYVNDAIAPLLQRNGWDMRAFGAPPPSTAQEAMLPLGMASRLAALEDAAVPDVALYDGTAVILRAPGHWARCNVLLYQKKGSGSTFSAYPDFLRGFLRSPHPLGANSSSQLRFNRLPEPVRSVEVLALEVAADGIGFGGIHGLHHQCAPCAMPGWCVRPQRQSGVMRVEQGIPGRHGIAAMARPSIVRRILDHAGAQRVEFDVALAAQQVGIVHDRA